MDTGYKEHIDYTTQHIESVIKRMADLLNDFSGLGRSLNDVEKCVLVCATLLHHTPITVENINSETDDGLQKHIVLIKNHYKCDCRRNDTECKCSDIAEIPSEVSWNGQTIRLQLLTAILRLCNAIDGTLSRLNINEINMQSTIAFR